MISSKGKEKAIEPPSPVTQQDLDDLLEVCRQNAEKAEQEFLAKQQAQEQVLTLEDDDPDFDDTSIPPLDPGPLPDPYLDLDAEDTKPGPSSSVLPPELDAPEPPMPPPELTKSGKPPTKKERKALKKQTAGPDWFDLPAPDPSELPQLHREVESLRLRNQLDPKRFYRKEEGEGKGIKGLPKYFAIGTMVSTPSPFGGASSDNLPKSHRKRTMVDELMDDAESKRYAKRKFNELRDVRGARGRNTLQAKKAARKPKW